MSQLQHDVVQGTSVVVSLLAQEQRTHIDTARAAFYLCRKPQTLNKWAFTGKGAVQPVRINGRLAWPVAEIRRLLGLC